MGGGRHKEQFAKMRLLEVAKRPARHGMTFPFVAPHWLDCHDLPLAATNITFEAASFGDRVNTPFGEH
jgi:hypothetical protein